MEETALRKFWSRYFKFDWKLGLFIFLLFVIIRYWIVLTAIVDGGEGGNGIFILFFLMWFVPFILFTRKGRYEIGIKKPDEWIKLLYSLVGGIAFCGISYLITYLLYGLSLNNSFVYMVRIFSLSPDLVETYRYKLFFISLIFSMTISPIGEEFLFRGVIHSCFVGKCGENKASIVNSLAFMIAHLPHFGILYIAGEWSFPFFPALLWMFFMFTLSRIFFKLKVYSKSIWAPVFAHAGYNAMMMYINFFILL